jgi:hypothetical protein
MKIYEVYISGPRIMFRLLHVPEYLYYITTAVVIVIIIIIIIIISMS